MRRPKMSENEAVDFAKAARKALFGIGSDSMIVGGGKSAAASPDRHLRQKVTMNLDGDLFRYFKDRARQEGRSYQLLINEALREYCEGTNLDSVKREVAKELLEDEVFLECVVEKIIMLQKRTVVGKHE